MVSRLGTVTSETGKVVILTELNMAKMFQVGEVLTLRKKVLSGVRDFGAQTVVTAVTEASPGVVTAAGHGLTTGDRVMLESLGGMVETQGLVYTITVVGVDTFSIGVNSSGYTSFTSGGYVIPLLESETWVEIALGDCIDVDEDNNTIEYDGTPSSAPVVGDIVLVKDGSEVPVGVLHSFVNPDDPTINTSVRYVYHGKVNKNLVRNWHSSYENTDGLRMILFLDREVN